MLALSLSDKFCCFGIFVFVSVNENHTGPLRHAEACTKLTRADVEIVDTVGDDRSMERNLNQGGGEVPVGGLRD